MFLFMTSLIVIFVLSGVLTSLRPELRLSSDSLHGIAGELPGDAFAHLLGMENHYFASELPEKDSFQLSRLSLKLATSINMEDPRSFLGRELPGFAQYDTEILLAGQGTDYTNMPAESPPPSKVMEKKRSEPGRNRKQNEKEETAPPKHSTGSKKSSLFITLTIPNPISLC